MAGRDIRPVVVASSVAGWLQSVITVLAVIAVVAGNWGATDAKLRALELRVMTLESGDVPELRR